MKKYLIIFGIIVVLVAVYFFIKLTPIITINPSHPLDRLGSSQPKDIVFAIENYIYATSTPIDEYASIRWAEKGTFKSDKISAFGIYIQSTDEDLISSQYNKTKEILEKNSFTKNEENSFGKFEKPNASNGYFSREDTGYQNKDIVCTVGISNQQTSIGQKYFLSLKCGVLSESF